MLKLNKTHIFNIFFVLAFIIILYHFIKIISPFFTAIFLALTFSILYYPLNIYLRKYFSNNISSAVSTISIFLTLILPLVLFGWLLFKETRNIYPKTISYLNENSNINLTIKFPDFLPINELDLKDIALKNISEIQDKILKSGSKILKNIFFIIVDIFVMLITLFFIFRDGDKFLKWLIEILPMNNEHIYKILNQFYLTIIAIVKGMVLTAIIQGITAGLGYYIAGCPSPVLFGMLTTISAAIPFLGTSTIWIPLGIFMFIFNNHFSGIFIILWGALVVGLIDNILRPILIGRHAKLPIFALFIGIFGGLRVYGPIGLFIGPILVSMAITFIEIYKENLKIKSNS